jgi:hypothetical protein
MMTPDDMREAIEECDELSDATGMHWGIVYNDGASRHMYRGILLDNRKARRVLFSRCDESIYIFIDIMCTRIGSWEDTLIGRVSARSANGAVVLSDFRSLDTAGNTRPKETIAEFGKRIADCFKESLYCAT